jgi:hypothetical protein
VYREDLIADLSEVAKAQGKAVQELFDERGVVFVEQSDYTIAGGDYKGNIFYGNTSKTDENGREDRKVVEHLIQIGRSRLYDRPLPQIKGRIVPTGNTGEGAGGGKGKLYNFKKSGQEPE